MTDYKTPPVWAINAARKRMGLEDEYIAGVELSGCIMNLALHIEASESATVDRKLLCAREAKARMYEKLGIPLTAELYRSGNLDFDLNGHVDTITLYEEGFGNDQVS